MSIRDGLRGLMIGIRRGPMIPVSDITSGRVKVINDKSSIKVVGANVPTQAQSKGASVQVIPGLGELHVIDTTQPPTAAEVPGSWSRRWMGPGQPFTPIEDSRAKDKESEPRSFQYLPNANAMFTPRIPYGIMGFADLRTYAETVPEVSMCLRLLTEELKSFVPTITDMADTKVDEPATSWMTTAPDRYTPWPVWLSRFLYDVLVYDAGSIYLIRDDHKRIMGARVIDGSTIFVLVDERGEQPAPPAPAFTQVIWGIPKLFLNTYQLWYHPRHPRVDAPYGRTPVEDSLPAVKLLQSLWDFECDKYTVGNVPAALVTCPPEWHDVDKILEYEDTYNARMVGANGERVKLRFMPAGMTVLNTPEITFNDDSYNAAANSVRLAFGIPQSEVGETPTGGLGGSGYAEAMQSSFYRMGLKPLIIYIEGLFNDILTMNGVRDRKFKLAFPVDSLDPEKEEDKNLARFTNGLTMRDEARAASKLPPLGGDEGKFLVTPGQGAQDEDGNGASPFGLPSKVKTPQTGAIKVRPALPEKVTVTKADFVESEHPRSENGEFGDKGGGAKKEGEKPTTPKAARPIREIGADIDAAVKAKKTAPPEIYGKLKQAMRPSRFNPENVLPYHGLYETELEDGTTVRVQLLHYTSYDRIGNGPIGIGTTKHEIEGTVSATDADGNHYNFTGFFHKRTKDDTEAAQAEKELFSRADKIFGIKDPEVTLSAADRSGDLQKATGVSPSDDCYFGAPVSQASTTEMPRQGADDSYIVMVKPANEEGRPAVWKPESGEDKALAASVGGKLYARDAATYLVDRELAENENRYLTPVTFVDELNGEPGSVQMYVPGPEELKSREDVSTYNPSWIEQAAALDYVTGQLDRDGRNWLTHPEDAHRPILIDSDVSFPHDQRPPRSSFVTAMQGEHISPEIKQGLALLAGNHALWMDIESLIDDQQAVEFARLRAQDLFNLNIWPVVEAPKSDATLPSEVVVKAQFEEDKHPRGEGGEFAPKGEGEKKPEAKAPVEPIPPAKRASNFKREASEAKFPIHQKHGELAIWMSDAKTPESRKQLSELATKHGCTMKLSDDRHEVIITPELTAEQQQAKSAKDTAAWDTEEAKRARDFEDSQKRREIVAELGKADEPIAKAYDPDEKRDDTGEWTAGAAGGKETKPAKEEQPEKQKGKVKTTAPTRKATPDGAFSFERYIANPTADSKPADWQNCAYLSPGGRYVTFAQGTHDEIASQYYQNYHEGEQPERHNADQFVSDTGFIRTIPINDDEMGVVVSSTYKLADEQIRKLQAISKRGVSITWDWVDPDGKTVDSGNTIRGLLDQVEKAVMSGELQKIAFEESEHPRANDGEFAPKGGEGGRRRGR